MRKPLIWDLVKDTMRFQFLPEDKVEHVVIDMTVTYQEQQGIWEDRGEDLLEVLNFNFTGLLRITNGGRL